MRIDLEKNKGPDVPKFMQEDIVFPDQIAKKYDVPEEFLKLIDGSWYACGMPIEKFLIKRDEKGKEFGVGNLLNLVKIEGNWYYVEGKTKTHIETWSRRWKRSESHGKDDFLYGRY